jgi:hypothetical protein
VRYLGKTHVGGQFGEVLQEGDDVPVVGLEEGLQGQDGEGWAWVKSWRLVQQE